MSVSFGRFLYEVPAEHRLLLIQSGLSEYGKLTALEEGKFGTIFTFDMPERSPRLIAFKCPKFTNFKNRQQAREAVGGLLHEFGKIHHYYQHHGIQCISGLEVVRNWPFLFSQRRDGTLRDLISSPMDWTFNDRMLSVLQVIRSLAYCQGRGLSAHQDLKPENIFISDLRRRFAFKQADVSLRYKTYVADFGLADAFREFGRNSGSRPYMAPEQYGDDIVDASKIDVFAIAVITVELLTDGQHPIGIRTNDVWPRSPQGQSRWERARTWRSWSSAPVKTLPEHVNISALTCDGLKILLAALSPDLQHRPDFAQMEHVLWDCVTENRDLLKQQLDLFDEEFTTNIDENWDFLDDCVRKLRELYANFDGDHPGS